MHYFDKYTGELRFASNEMYDAWSMAQNMSSQTQYLMMINNSACRLFIFQGSKGNWTPLFDWVCSPGKDSTPTVRGNYTVAARGLHFGEDKGYTCYYWTQFYGDYLFHSILYYPGSMNPMEPWLGQRLSHGCVRLSIENARLIYDMIPRGTKVYIYLAGKWSYYDENGRGGMGWMLNGGIDLINRKGLDVSSHVRR